MAHGRRLQERVYQRALHPSLWLMAPVALLFRFLTALRRLAYRRGWRAVRRLPVPVVVVGNLTVGGAGKTPLVLALCQALRAAGWRPGIISRGYGRVAGVGANTRQMPLSVQVAAGAEAGPEQVGDEPVLLARRSGVPVWVCQDRFAAGQALLQAHPDVNVLLCDDGLQHYGLARDFEIAVFDGRGIGNGWPLPMGPMREPLARLRGVDAVVFNGAPDHRVLKAVSAHAVARGPVMGGAGSSGGTRGTGGVASVNGAAAPVLEGAACFSMDLHPGAFYRLGAPDERCEAASLKGRSLHAVAGIGDPGRFFRTLESLGLSFAPHPFPDHHAYQLADLVVPPGEVILMTEKDSVKCEGLALGEAWVLPVEAELPPALIDVLLEKLDEYTTA